jgi:transposase InsO family protein
MGRKQFTTEKIIGMLREADVALAQGMKVGEICRKLEVSEQKFRDELLNRELFFTLKEAKIVIDNWRREYNTIRPHSSLNNRPPAPEAILPPLLHQPWVIGPGQEMDLTLT